MKPPAQRNFVPERKDDQRERPSFYHGQPRFTPASVTQYKSKVEVLPFFAHIPQQLPGNMMLPLREVNDRPPALQLRVAPMAGAGGYETTFQKTIETRDGVRGSTYPPFCPVPIALISVPHFCPSRPLLERGRAILPNSTPTLFAEGRMAAFGWAREPPRAVMDVRATRTVRHSHARGSGRPGHSPVPAQD